MNRLSSRLAYLVLAAAALALAPNDAARADGPCAPSKFGAKDQIGAANNLSPAKTLAAAKLITKGKAYRLGIETSHNTPAYAPRTFNLRTS